MRGFEEFVCVGGLRESPLSNAKFTWTNGLSNLVMSRLDRFLVMGD